MADANKVIQTVEKLGGDVSTATVIAAIAAFIMLLYVFYTKHYPVYSSSVEKRVNKRMDIERQKQQVQKVIDDQKNLDQKFNDMYEMVKELSESVKHVDNKLEGIVDGHKVTWSVLLDIVECMQAKTSPEECASRAQSKINSYIGSGFRNVQ